MNYIELNAIVFYSLVILILLLITTIAIIVVGYLRYKKSNEELSYARDEIMAANMDLEAHTEELIASNEELDRQFIELQENKEKMRKLVDYDQLTGFMNSHKFIESIKETTLNHQPFYLIYLTISNIDDVSNSMGLGIYESLLSNISKGLISTLGLEHYTYGIIKGDDIILLTNQSQQAVKSDMDKVISLFNSPFYSDFISFRLLIKGGIALFPNDERDPEKLVKKAGIAAITQLASPVSAYTFFSDVMQLKILEEQKKYAQIDIAIQEKQFLMYYQPKFASDGKQLMGYEALIRWRMPDGTIRSPGEFIDIAEKTGQIIYIGRQVIDMVCSDIQQYGLDKHGIHISLNLSSQHLENDDTIQYLKRSVNKYDIDSRSIEIEITETSIVKNYDLTSSLLKRLRHDGFTIALDDFGTGYSSLSYIRNLPINKIKIDREFISRMPNVKYMKVLKAIMNLSKDLYYKVTVEGIETKEQWDMLIPFEPNELQGFYFSKPLPIEEAIKYLTH